MIEKIETRLSELIPARDEAIFEAARYSLLSPGKRLRPLLTLTTASLLGADPFIALDPACALEMIHTYSLIHDDLPCMDDDDFRRGRLSLHKVYGEAKAVLTGDYLLTTAFAVLAHAPGLTAEQKIEMIQTVAMRAGAPGLIGGQVIDIESEGKEIDEETRLQMNEEKTAALITACFECGRIAAGASSPLLTSIGRDLGVIYQLQDDLLDAERIEGTQEQLQHLEQTLTQKLDQLPHRGGELALLIQKIFQRKS